MGFVASAPRLTAGTEARASRTSSRPAWAGRSTRLAPTRTPRPCRPGTTPPPTPAWRTPGVAEAPRLVRRQHPRPLHPPLPHRHHPGPAPPGLPECLGRPHPPGPDPRGQLPGRPRGPVREPDHRRAEQPQDVVPPRGERVGAPGPHRGRATTRQPGVKRTPASAVRCPPVTRADRLSPSPLGGEGERRSTRGEGANHDGWGPEPTQTTRTPRGPTGPNVTPSAAATAQLGPDGFTFPGAPDRY